MNLRFTNCRLLTADMTVLDKAELITSGDKIVFSGKAEDATAFAADRAFDRVIDCGNDLLMPGFKNAHTHTAMTFARSLADDLTLSDWLQKAIFPMEAKLTADHIYWFLKLGFAEYITNGITSCFDMYFQPDVTAKAAVDTGFRFVFCGSVNDFGGIDRLEDEYNRFNSYDDLVSYKLGFHAEYTTSENIMKTISDIAHKYEAPVFAHVSETEAEVSGCVGRYGKSPVKVFDELGLYDFGGGGFHCVWFDDDDMKIYKDKGLYAVFNACSNLKLASGIAPVAKFREYGINTAIENSRYQITGYGAEGTLARRQFRVGDGCCECCAAISAYQYSYTKVILNVTETWWQILRSISYIAADEEAFNQYYSDYECEKHELPLRHLIYLAEFYQVTTDFLLGRTQKKTG